MKYFILALIFLISIVFSIFSSYMFFIPYEIFSFLIILILTISNKAYPSLPSSNTIYVSAFIVGLIMDCIEHNIIFYNAFVFVLIVYLNDFIKSIWGSKFVIVLIFIIGFYEYLTYGTYLEACLFHITTLLIYYRIIQKLLSLAYAQKN